MVARTALGTINHTLLTLAEIARRGLRLVGVVASHSAGPLSAADSENFAHLREVLGDRLVGEIPPLAAGQMVWVNVGSAKPLAEADKIYLRVDDPNKVSETSEGDNSFIFKG